MSASRIAIAWLVVHIDCTAGTFIVEVHRLVVSCSYCAVVSVGTTLDTPRVWLANQPAMSRVHYTRCIRRLVYNRRLFHTLCILIRRQIAFDRV